MRFLTPFLALQISACSVIQDFLDVRDQRRPSRSAEVPLEKQSLQEPISRNYFVLESPEQTVVGEPQIVFTRSTDTFSDLAREYGLGYDELVAANPGIDPWLPGKNMPVLLPTQYVLPDTPRRGLILNIASKRLFYYPPVDEGDRVQVMTYPIGIGRIGWETPIGDTKVVAKARDPHWYVPWSVQQEHKEMGDPLPSVVPPGLELAEQVATGVISRPDRLYVATGTMGTAAGLAIGLALAELRTEVQAVRVSDPLIMNEAALHKLIGKIALMLRRTDSSIPDDLENQVRIVVRDNFFAGGYAMTNDATDAAVQFAKDQLDIKLETTYTGKAMAALLNDLDDAEFADKKFLFWNTYSSAELPVPVDKPLDEGALPDEFMRYFE